MISGDPLHASNAGRNLGKLEKAYFREQLSGKLRQSWKIPAAGFPDRKMLFLPGFWCTFWV